MAMAPNEPGFFSRLGSALVDAASGIVDAVGEIASAVGEWIVENAKTLGIVGDMLSFISTVAAVGALALLATGPIGMATAAGLTAVATGFAAGALAFHGAAALGGADVPFRSFVQDSLGVIPVLGLFGRAAHALTRTPVMSSLGNIGTADSVFGLLEDHSVLENFAPPEPIEWGQFQGSELLGRFDAAWRQPVVGRPA
ncbi:hypothetical protein [Streptomyces sedi]|uniref:Uncharacterized protein n=1 Tax=Streptomyces sedi TaxID=555059 RepID=A0A5C4VEQ6_9ACTN|nr:hypothetical protein [Streptomyces sedi]TNM34384.1 hypothetical protein FH715_01510 [Streptomyces sedi]